MPPPRARMCGMAACIRMNGARRLTAMMRSQSASGTDSTVPRVMSAALLTRTSRPPNSRTANRTTWWQSSASARLPATNTARPPASRMPSTTAVPCAALRAVHDDGGAERREVLRDALADARRRAGDDGDAVRSSEACRSLAAQSPSVSSPSPALASRTLLITRPSCMPSNASRQPSSPVRRPTITSARVRPAGEQVDHALPDRPVVAERSLQRARSSARAG